MADHHAELDQPLVVIALGELPPCGIENDPPVMDFVRRPEHGGVMDAPSRGFGAFGNAGDVGRFEAAFQPMETC